MNNNPNYKDAGLKGGLATKQKWEKIKNDYLKNPSKCSYCDTVLPYKKRKSKFCSKSCTASYTNKNRKISELHRKKTSKTLKERGKVNYLKNPKKCKMCKSIIPYEIKRRKTCSDDCYKKSLIIGSRLGGKIGGKASARIQSETRRSKNEILFAEKCKEYFDSVLTNESIFNGWDADVIIKDIKVAVLWNGKWHYEKITEKHSVKQVQNRDKIKIGEIKKCGYIPYVIKDLGSFSEKKVSDEFSKFLERFG